ncbi:MAG: DUF1292 domain-containing protein [Tissierellia bacterium]|nr:DUF1292 domain-containing protein [Tissierellia bacterium]MDD4780814.1 DUF1292 domain-containing protein [Tissierellia bacterium]
MSEDKDLCGCGCGCDDDDCGCHDEDILTLTLEDGTEIECAVIAVFPVEEKDYIALLPLENQEDGEVFLYGYEEYEDGTFELISIESDEEYEAVTSAFDEILDEAEIDELMDDEDY